MHNELFQEFGAPSQTEFDYQCSKATRILNIVDQQIQSYPNEAAKTCETVKVAIELAQKQYREALKQGVFTQETLNNLEFLARNAKAFALRKLRQDRDQGLLEAEFVQLICKNDVLDLRMSS